MNRIKSFFALIFTIATFSVLSVNAQSYTSANQAAEKTVEQKVYKEILKLPRYGVFDFISFQVNGSTVTLTGKVYSLGTKGQAARYVKDIAGVSTVINNIEELPLSSFDDQIRREALRTFARHGLYRYFWETRPDVRIIVENGRITLEGYVANSGDYNTLNILANGVSNVFRVQNNLIVGKSSN
ncbi:MAG: BON domain-containing protein [Pyrinomonadaceae bacterium]